MNLAVYQTDDDGYLVATIEADPDPLNPGNWLVPRGCVGTQPPTLAVNETARWLNSEWVKQPDHRGREYWLPDGSHHVIVERGIALPQDALDAPPAPQPLTPEQRVALVKAEAQRRIYAVVPSWKQANLIARGAELLRIRIEAGTWTAQELAEADAIDAIWAKAKAIRSYSDGLEADILSGNTPDIMIGWPE